MDKMQALLNTEEFQEKVCSFIKANLQAYLPGLESADSVKEIPNDVEDHQIMMHSSRTWKHKLPVQSSYTLSFDLAYRQKEVEIISLEGQGQLRWKYATDELDSEHAEGEKDGYNETNTASNSNVINFFINSYEVDIEMKTKTPAIVENNLPESDLSRLPQCHGRPHHEKVPYLPAHPKAKQKQHIIHGWGHNNLPNFIGCYFPCCDDPDQHQFYCTCMLLLLKPWREIEMDLKKSNETWEVAFNTFLAMASQKMHHIIFGIQYFHKLVASQDFPHHSASGDTNTNGDLDQGLSEDYDDQHQATMTEEGLTALITSQIPWHEELHGHMAVEAAKAVKIFSQGDAPVLYSPSPSPSQSLHSREEGKNNKGQPAILGICNATSDDIQHLLEWKKQMVDDINSQNPGICRPPTDSDIADRGSVHQFTVANGQLPSVSYLGEDCKLSELAILPCPGT
ncbi:hypothetical protein F5141DRAFT_1066906 [Pisolithus sp. B1]|nr:hypothetical protein F5141DRAFT_1066906 [Pisolithus sp. B1]